MDAKKRRRVGFANMADEGVEANECIKIFLVNNQDEVGLANGFCIDPIDLNHFFGEDGRIYGYKCLKINIWLSTVSFHAYADITHEGTFDGGKGITNLKPALQDIFGETLLEKSEFLQTFSTESNYIKSIITSGAVLQCYTSNKAVDSSDTHCNGSNGSTMEHQIVRMDLQSLPVGLLYSRLVPLTFLLIDGSSPIDVTDPNWDIYFAVKKMPSTSGDYCLSLLGFATVYRFYHHPDSTRLRLSQVLVLPPYQGQGHGRHLLESINSISITENVYDVTVEEPSEYLQYLRSCIDTLRLLDFNPIKQNLKSAVLSLEMNCVTKKASRSQVVPQNWIAEIVRQKLKINKKQFLRCWDILIHLKLDPNNCKSMENFKASISTRIKSEILGKDSDSKGKRLIEVPNEYDHDMTFVVYCPGGGEELENLDETIDGDRSAQEQQLNALVVKQMQAIDDIAKKDHCIGQVFVQIKAVEEFIILDLMQNPLQHFIVL
ncbi:hypothetical protein HPP92_008881 [Vanilla planifolia]|uniref:histone acetyltransferase n=1 Tax=Vanilla planifolia TaxID=51239 RepID=A0A835R6R9_VANPL|nr:hypothetical protein HPP92_008881 [Vanilla planifolia]